MSYNKDLSLLPFCFQVFGTSSNLKVLEASWLIFADGTFYSAPGLFYHLYTIHGMFRNEIVPLAYVLLPDKREETYSRLLGIIKAACTVQGIFFNPEQAMLDFEKAAINAFRQNFPNIRVKLCAFHFSQSLWRKIHNLGLQALAEDNIEYKRAFRQCCGLPATSDWNPGCLFADYGRCSCWPVKNEFINGERSLILFLDAVKHTL